LDGLQLLTRENNKEAIKTLVCRPQPPEGGLHSIINKSPLGDLGAINIIRVDIKKAIFLNNTANL
jgi:hypothetical protein